MTEQPKTNRTQLTDLPVAEQEMTAEEMAKVQGGKTTNETRSNPTIAAVLPPLDSKTQTPLPSATTARQTPKKDFGDQV